MPKLRNTRPLSHLPNLCDVPGCKGPGERVPLGHLCRKHAMHFEAALRRDVVFTTDVFLVAAEHEDGLAREECYSRWLGEVAQAT